MKPDESFSEFKSNPDSPQLLNWVPAYGLLLWPFEEHPSFDPFLAPLLVEQFAGYLVPS